MKTSKYTERQIIKILKSHESGPAVADLCREHEISDATFYQWRKQYGVWKRIISNGLRIWRKRTGV